MKKDSPFTVRLGPLRKAWSDFCKSREIPEGEGVRLLISNALRVADKASVIQDGEAAAPKARVELRLTAGELEAIRVRAEATGFTANRWIVALIRAHLNAAPQFGDLELTTLADSNYQLSAIGRNLNMLARDLKASPDTIEPYRFKVLEHLKKQIDDHLKVVHEVIQANLARWKRPGR